MPKAKIKKAPAKKTGKEKALKKTAPKKAAVKKSLAKKNVPKKTSGEKMTTKPATKKTDEKTTPNKKTVAKKTLIKKAPAKKADAKQTAAKNPAPKKKVSVKETSAKKSPKSNTKITSTSKKQAALEGTDILAMGDTPIAPYEEKSGESYMGEKQTAHFHNILNTWKQALMQEVDRTVHHMQDEASNFPDPNDRASQESEFTIELRTRDRERKLIKKIDESLALLDSEDYGYCETCGIEIGIRRLEARPTATQCIDCKTLDEIKEKQISR
ncbi:MAG: RNA polymerase-binding protein DksA [Gammaproteobacteria bacterium]|nr:MAG: RNA polymerase-binding protein DksA [Gammaproteobacteria bacterium]